MFLFQCAALFTHGIHGNHHYMTHKCLDIICVEFRQFRDFTASSFKLILLRLIKLVLPQITKIRFQTLKLHLIYDTTSFGHLYFLLTFDLSNSCSVKFPI